MKKFNILFLFALILVITNVLSACNNTNDEPKKDESVDVTQEEHEKDTQDTNSTEDHKEGKDADDIKEELTTDKETEKQEYTEEELFEIGLEAIRKNVESYMTIDYDPKNKTMIGKIFDDYTEEAIEWLKDGTMDKSTWENYTATPFIKVMKRIKESVGDGYSFTIINPFDENDILLLIIDGEVVINFTDDV